MHVEDFLSVRPWSFLCCVTVSVFADKSLNFTVRLVAGGRAGAFATSHYAWCVGHAFSVRIAPRFIRSLWWTVEKVCHYFGTEKVRQKTVVFSVYFHFSKMNDCIRYFFTLLCPLLCERAPPHPKWARYLIGYCAPLRVNKCAIMKPGSHDKCAIKKIIAHLVYGTFV